MRGLSRSPRCLFHGRPGSVGSRRPRGRARRCLRQGGLIAKRVRSAAAIGSSGIRWTRRPGVKRARRGTPPSVAGVAAAGDEEERVSGPQPSAGRAPTRLGDVAERAEAGVRGPVGDPARSCSRGGRRRARRPRRPARSGSGPPPSRRVVALVAGDRDAAQGRRVGVVGPVLDVEVAGAAPEQSAPAAASPLPARQSTTWTKAVTGRPRRCGGRGPRGGPSPQAVLRQRRKSTGTAREPSSKASVGMCSRTSLPTSVP